MRASVRAGEPCARVRAAMAIDAYFVDAEPGDREIYEAVANALIDHGPVEIEAVSVGILFKRSRTFVELRPRKRGMACSMILPHALTSERATRRIKLGHARRRQLRHARLRRRRRREMCEWLAMAYNGRRRALGEPAGHPMRAL